MSASPAVRRHFSNSTPSSESLTNVAVPRRRTGRIVAFMALVCLLPIVLSIGILLFCPPVLEGMSAMLVPPRPGTIQWNGHDRITVVAMGLTQRTTEPARTDTLLVMDIDPVHHHINELSVPRDLWVNIPGYGPGKLAIAYEIGGPRLAAYTLEHELGIPVDYYAAFTFHGFAKLVNAMGGVTVHVPQELKDPTYPCLVGYDYCPIDIKPGTQHMDGWTALEFVRERHAFLQQDLARVQDQQAFSDAVKRQMTSPATWLRFPAMLNALKTSLITNLPLNDVPAIGAQFALARSSGVNHQYINVTNGMVKTDWSSDGQSILEPTSSTVIPNLVHQLFGDQQLARDHASIDVLNGTSTPGAAADVETALAGLGFHTVAAGNADASTYRQTQVIVNTAVAGPAQYTARRLQRELGAALVRRPIPGQAAQIEVIVGNDLPVGSGQTAGQ